MSKYSKIDEFRNKLLEDMDGIQKQLCSQNKSNANNKIKKEENNNNNNHNTNSEFQSVQQSSVFNNETKEDYTKDSWHKFLESEDRSILESKSQNFNQKSIENNQKEHEAHPFETYISNDSDKIKTNHDDIDFMTFQKQKSKGATEVLSDKVKINLLPDLSSSLKKTDDSTGKKEFVYLENSLVQDDQVPVDHKIDIQDRKEDFKNEDLPLKNKQRSSKIDLDSLSQSQNENMSKNENLREIFIKKSNKSKIGSLTDRSKTKTILNPNKLQINKNKEKGHYHRRDTDRSYDHKRDIKRNKSNEKASQMQPTKSFINNINNINENNKGLKNHSTQKIKNHKNMDRSESVNNINKKSPKNESNNRIQSKTQNEMNNESNTNVQIDSDLKISSNQLKNNGNKSNSAKLTNDSDLDSISILSPGNILSPSQNLPNSLKSTQIPVNSITNKNKTSISSFIKNKHSNFISPQKMKTANDLDNLVQDSSERDLIQKLINSDKNKESNQIVKKLHTNDSNETSKLLEEKNQKIYRLEDRITLLENDLKNQQKEKEGLINIIEQFKDIFKQINNKTHDDNQNTFNTINNHQEKIISNKTKEYNSNDQYYDINNMENNSLLSKIDDIENQISLSNNYTKTTSEESTANDVHNNQIDFGKSAKDFFKKDEIPQIDFEKSSKDVNKKEENLSRPILFNWNNYDTFKKKSTLDNNDQVLAPILSNHESNLHTIEELEINTGKSHGKEKKLDYTQNPTKIELSNNDRNENISKINQEINKNKINSKNDEYPELIQDYDQSKTQDENYVTAKSHKSSLTLNDSVKASRLKSSHTKSIESNQKPPENSDPRNDQDQNKTKNNNTINKIHMLNRNGPKNNSILKNIQNEDSIDIKIKLNNSNKSLLNDQRCAKKDEILLENNKLLNSNTTKNISNSNKNDVNFKQNTQDNPLLKKNLDKNFINSIQSNERKVIQDRLNILQKDKYSNNTNIFPNQNQIMNNHDNSGRINVKRDSNQYQNSSNNRNYSNYENETDRSVDYV